VAVSFATQSPRVTGIVHEAARSLGEGLVPAVIYNDPEIHQAELERIFGRAWCFVGHESEVRNPGDYCLRYVGEDPFIFVRDEEGRIRLFFDACRHRGTQVCRAEKGNASHFRCPYHGWTYKNDGRLVGVPAGSVAYKGFDRSQHGLLEAAQLEVADGLVFACLDPAGPSLDSFLGDMRWYLDLIFRLGEPMVIGEPHRWLMDANWKIGAENFAGDDYHTITLHKSMWDIGVVPVSVELNMIGNHVWAGGEHATHSLSFAIDPTPDSNLWWGIPPEVVALLDKSGLTAEQVDLGRRARVTVGTVFPNLSLIFVSLSPDPTRRRPVNILGLRQWQPRGPGHIELWNWIFSWREAPAEYTRETYQAHMATFGTSGIFEQDDTEPWSSITRAAGSTMARLADVKLNYQMGLNGIGTAEVISDWPGPGTAWSNRYEEGVMRNLVADWVRYMDGG
jgi:nitrite reductase/ring-hydroxylating ferredoxin subunit